uniref:Translation initiation factor 1 n=1 Tax=Peronospora matthiolae TaxID=2874970 RepID=A0AAV1UTQ4_9STRA
MRDIVVFGSTCDLRQDPGKNSLQRQSEKGTIIGRNDETKGYKMCLR